MPPRPTYCSILDVAFGWHGIPVPTRIRRALPPVVRITAAMLLRAIVDTRLAVYEPASSATTDAVKPRRASVVMEEAEGTPGALAEMSAAGSFDPTVLAHYRLSIDELYLWAVGEDLDPPSFSVPSWTCVERPATAGEPRKLRPDMCDKRVCQTIAKRRWCGGDRIGVAAMARDREIQIEGNGRLYRESTVRRWLYEVAPATVRRKSRRLLDNRSPESPRHQAI